MMRMLVVTSATAMFTSSWDAVIWNGPSQFPLQALTKIGK